MSPGPLEHLAFFREAFEAAPVGALIVDGEGVLVAVNRQLEQIFGYTREELLGQPVELLIDGAALSHRVKRERYATAPSERPMGHNRDLFGRHRRGHQLALEVGLTPLVSQGPLYVMASVIDLTERVRARDELTAALDEKEALLLAVHRRAKSSLQLVANLLDLAAASASPHVLAECHDRLTSVALVHELLSQSNTPAHLELRPYLEQLSAQVARTWSGAHTADIDVRLEVEDISLPLSDAIPCGLVVNELLTNAFKHAYPADRGGTVIVAATQSARGVRVRVEDDGVGLPVTAALSIGHLGLDLARSLARQLNGELIFGEGRGTAVTLAFQGARA